MPTTKVFWRLSLGLTIFALLSVLAWGLVCGSPPPENSVGELAAWRWKCLFMLLTTLCAALLVARILIRLLTEPLTALNRVAQQLAKAAPSLVLVENSASGAAPIADVFQNVSQHVAAHIADLQTEQLRLEQSHDRLAIVLEAMVEGVIAVDPDERILLANGAALRLLDLKPHGISGHSLWELVRIPRLQELVNTCIKGADQHRLEIPVPRTQATVAAVISRLPGDPCPGAVIVLHDVTDLRRLENLRREFVSNVSHELKTPLAAISGYTETLLDGALEEPETSRAFVSRISEQADRLNALILDLLELARVETSENHALEITPVDIGQVLEASVNEHVNVAVSKNLTLRAESSEKPVWGMADAGGLRTIADNLIDNAINYTPSGGQIIVRWWNDGDWVRLEVADTGVGIAKEYQTRIFERFFRVDRARSREVGGTGLGLSIVKHLCQVFDGEIKVSSRLGHGSTFMVRLPAAKREA